MSHEPRSGSDNIVIVHEQQTVVSVLRIVVLTEAETMPRVQALLKDRIFPAHSPSEVPAKIMTWIVDIHHLNNSMCCRITGNTDETSIWDQRAQILEQPLKTDGMNDSWPRIPGLT